MQGKLILQGAILAAAIVCTWSNRARILDAGTGLAVPQFGGAGAAATPAPAGYTLKSGAILCSSRNNPSANCYPVQGGTPVDVVEEQGRWSYVRAGVFGGWVASSKIEKGGR